MLRRAERRLEQLRARPGVPFIGDGVGRTVNLLDDYVDVIAVCKARCQFLGELLADQYAAAQDGDVSAGPAWGADSDTWDVGPGVDATEPAGSATGLGGPAPAAGLVGYTYTASVVGEGGRDGATSLERVATGEQMRALVELEGKERDRLAALLKDAARLGMDLERTEVMRGYAATASAAMRTLIAELGLDMNAEPVLRAAGRAGLIARRTLGHDDGDPDMHAGPALTHAERARVLTAALDRTREQPRQPMITEGSVTE